MEGWHRVVRGMPRTAPPPWIPACAGMAGVGAGRQRLSDPYAPGMCGALRSEYSTVSGMSSFSSSMGHGPSFLKLR